MAGSSSGNWSACMDHNVMRTSDESISAATLERAYIAWVVRGSREDFGSVCQFYHQLRQYEMTLTQEDQARGSSLPLIHASDLPDQYPGGLDPRPEARVPLYMRRPRRPIESQHSVPTQFEEISAVNELVTNFLQTTGTAMTTLLEDFEGFRDQHNIQPSLSAIAYFVELRTLQYQRDGSLVNAYRGYAANSVLDQVEPNQREIDNTLEAPNALNLGQIDDALHNANVLRNEQIVNSLVDSNLISDPQSEQSIQPPSYESIMHEPNPQVIRPQRNPGHVLNHQFQYILPPRTSTPLPHYIQPQPHAFRSFNQPNRPRCCSVPIEHQFFHRNPNTHQYVRPWYSGHEAMTSSGQPMMPNGNVMVLNEGHQIIRAVYAPISISRQFVNQENAALIGNAQVMYPSNITLHPANVVVVNNDQLINPTNPEMFDNGQPLHRDNVSSNSGQIRIARRNQTSRGRSNESRSHGNSIRGSVCNTRQGDALREALGIRNDDSVDGSGAPSNENNVRSKPDDYGDLYD